MARSATIVRDFHDAGTGKAFNEGATVHDLTDGEFTNYEAAGLVTETAAPAETEQPYAG